LIDLNNKTLDGRVIIKAEDFDLSYVADNNDKFSCWINTSPRFLFKANSLGTIDECEILSHYIAKAVGVDSVNVFPAVFIDDKGNYLTGVLSEDFIKDRQKSENIRTSNIVGSGIGNGVYNHVKCLQNLAVESLKQNKFLLIDEHIETNLLKMCLFDYLTFQKDRAKRNIEYIYEKNDMEDNSGTIYLAPMFDNSWMFYAHHTSMFNEIFNDLLQCKNEKERFEYLNQKTKNFNFEFFVKTTSFFIGSQKTIFTNELCAQILKNERLYDVYINFKNLNLNKIQQQIQKELNFKIDDDLIFVAQNLFNFQYNNLEQFLNMRREQNFIRQSLFEF